MPPAAGGIIPPGPPEGETADTDPPWRCACSPFGGGSGRGSSPPGRRRRHCEQTFVERKDGRLLFLGTPPQAGTPAAALALSRNPPGERICPGLPGAGGEWAGCKGVQTMAYGLFLVVTYVLAPFPSDWPWRWWAAASIPGGPAAATRGHQRVAAVRRALRRPDPGPRSGQGAFAGAGRPGHDGFLAVRVPGGADGRDRPHVFRVPVRPGRQGRGHRHRRVLGRRAGCGPAGGAGCVAVIWASGYVSAGSLVLAVALPLLCFFVGPAALTPAAVVVAGLIVWKHRENIARLRAGQEKSWRKGRDKTGG